MQHVKQQRHEEVIITCDPSYSPILWIRTILAQTQRLGGSRTAKHLLGATLALRFSKSSGFQGLNLITAVHTRQGIFEVGRFAYLGGEPSRRFLRKCRKRTTKTHVPVLIVLAEDLPKAHFYASEQGMKEQLNIFGLESFVGTSLMLMSIERNDHPINTLRAIISAYNVRVLQSREAPTIQLEESSRITEIQRPTNPITKQKKQSQWRKE